MPKKMEVEWFYEDLQDLLELTAKKKKRKKKKVLFNHRELEWKIRKSKYPEWWESLAFEYKTNQDKGWQSFVNRKHRSYQTHFSGNTRDNSTHTFEWFALETNWDYPVIFEIAPKYCIFNSFVDYEGYSISSKGFLPTVVEIMGIWIISCPF